MDIILVYLGILTALGVFGSSQSTCDDFDKQVCGLFYRRIEMCSDPCYSSLCPRTCQKCPLMCYHCDSGASINGCNTTQICPSMDHKCIVSEAIGDDFTVMVKFGCATTSVCRSLYGYHSSMVVIGREAPKKRVDLHGSCCDTDLCNAHSSDPPSMDQSRAITVPPLTGCDDIDMSACQRLASLKSGMCSDSCLSKACPRTCGKCVQCYSCPHVSSTEICNQTTLCQSNEKCYTLETLNSDNVHGFKLGCVQEGACTHFHSHASHVFGKRGDTLELALDGDCCTGSLCNYHAQHHATLPTPPPLTGCIYSSEDHHCPHNFHLISGKCYYIGGSHLNYTEGQKYCNKRCSILAEDLSQSDMNHLKDRIDDTTVLTGAVDHGHNGQFVWNYSRNPAPHPEMDNNKHPDNTCAVLRRVSEDVRLVNNYCSYHFKPLCQAKMLS